jgi:hypothetical protein
MKQFFLVLIFLSAPSLIQAQRNFDITSNSAGGVRLGMTLEQARRTLSNCQLRRTQDGEGIALVGVRCSGREVMSFYAGEEDRDAKVNWKRRIELIEVWDKRFKTADRVHPGMLLRDAEKILGKVSEIIITQIESREFVTFRKNRKGIEYRTYGGLYTRPNYTTKMYEPGSRLHSIQVSGDN